MSNRPGESVLHAAELRVDAPKALGFDGRRLRQAMAIVEEGQAAGVRTRARRLW